MVDEDWYWTQSDKWDKWDKGINTIDDSQLKKRQFINWIGEEPLFISPKEDKFLCPVCGEVDDEDFFEFSEDNELKDYTGCECWICDNCVVRVHNDRVIFTKDELPYCPDCFEILSSLDKDFDDSSAAAGARA